MHRLVAIDLPGGQQFVEALLRIWDDGDAALPLDRRAPPAARQVVVAALAPTHLLNADGLHTLGGLDVEEGDALVMATSGATGTPKGVVLTHTAIAAAARSTSQRLATTEADTWLACLPLAHVGGLGVVTRALLTGSKLVVHPEFDALAVHAAAADGATAVALVATALRRIDASLFRVILVGGGRPPAPRPRNVVTTYGLTETGGGVVYDGRPLDGVEVRISTDGEVLIRGTTTMRCYRDGTTAVDTDGWLHTGDCGRWTDAGLLHIDGRRGDMIITGGENVWPDQVEAVLATHHAVAQVAVAGIDDPEWGQRVVAWVVPPPDVGAPSLAELREHASTTLPAFAAPRELRVVASLPAAALGKLARSRLGSL